MFITLCDINMPALHLWAMLVQWPGPLHMVLLIHSFVHFICFFVSLLIYFVCLYYLFINLFVFNYLHD